MQKARTRKRPSARANFNPARISKKISEIWTHYRAFPERGAVECNYCWKLLKRTDSSTKNMWGHMKAFHADQLSDTKPASKERKEKQPKTGIALPIKPPDLPTTTHIDLEPNIVNMSTNDTISSIISSVAAAGALTLPKDELLLNAVASIAMDNKTPTQPYVKRARAGTGTSGATTPMNLQPTMSEQTSELLKKPFAFLESIPRINEVLNISAGGFAPNETEENHASTAHDVNPCAPSGSRGAESPGQADDCSSSEGIPSANSPPTIQTNPLSSLLCSVAANPLAYMNAMQALVGQTSLLQQYQLRAAAASAVCEQISLPTPVGPALSPSQAFTLGEGSCVTQLMKMAIDLDLTMSYHRRRGDLEMCFESNRTAEKSGARGKVLCLTDCGRDIRVTERTNGNVTESELWTKTDFNQFHWAIRGRCQKLLLR